ncbi:MAG TPA: glycosyltransferase family 4 protein [Tepidisphaeraceae bacterium]|nr:glycosyltransferase family 4 protein [Tepidisphaeraceae bacterium]
MKSLIICADFPPFLSGIGDFTDRLASAMTRAGQHVSVLTMQGSDDGVKRPYEVLRVMPSFGMKSMDTLLDIARDFDVVNIQYPGVHFGRSPMINLLPPKLKRLGVASVVTIHDARVMRWRWRLRTWPMLNTVSGIIHVDPGDWPIIKSWLTFGAPPRACVPIASNVEMLDATVADVARWRNELGIQPDETACAFFGILYPHKGVDELIDAVTTLRARGHKLKLVVIGDFDREADWRPAMEKRLKSDEIVWVRGASLDRVSECLHACDIAALPFHSGTSVNRSSMLATLAHGLPTITTDGPNTPKEIRELFDLELVPIKDVTALTSAIERVLTDDALRNRLRENASKASKRISWDSVARQTSDFHKQIAQSRGAKCAS